jgi:TRAP-type C4-dicarboxylate transport system permease small subunit
MKAPEAGTLGAKEGGNMQFMTILDKFEKFNRLVSSWFEWVGLTGLLIMMLITCIDVIGAKIFLLPVLGAIDIAMLSQVVAISFACAMALILGRHVQVEFIVTRLPRRVQAVTDSIVFFLGLFFFVLVVWRLCVHGYHFQTGGELSATARIPLYLFAYGIALASIPVCLVCLQKFLKSLMKVEQR